MARDRPGPDRDRTLAGRLTSIAQRHARWGALTEEQEAAGAAELREIVGDRPDLLAEVAGLALGTAEARGQDYEARGQAIAELCRLAGADESLIPQWTEKAGAGSRSGASPRSATRRRVHRRGPRCPGRARICRLASNGRDPAGAGAGRARKPASAMPRRKPAHR
jgi:hypothetical protein